MPYLLLVIGLIVGLYALYRFFINANIKQIKALFMSAGLVTVIVALFVMAVTGRLAAALGLGAAIIPFVIAYLRERNADRLGDERYRSRSARVYFEQVDDIVLDRKLGVH